MRWKRYDNCEAIDAQLWSKRGLFSPTSHDDHAGADYSLVWSSSRPRPSFSRPNPFGGGASGGGGLSPWMSVHVAAAFSALVGMACRQVVQWRNDVKRVGEQSGGCGRLLVLRARDAQAFAELGVAYWLSRRKGHHARTREKARGGEISGDERVVSLADERTRSGSKPKLKAARRARGCAIQLTSKKTSCVVA